MHPSLHKPLKFAFLFSTNADIPSFAALVANIGQNVDFSNYSPCVRLESVAYFIALLAIIIVETAFSVIFLTMLTTQKLMTKYILFESLALDQLTHIEVVGSSSIKSLCRQNVSHRQFFPDDLSKSLGTSNSRHQTEVDLR